MDKVDDLYRNTICLAPMVRMGTLPMRLLALQYGADTVYGEELVDRAVMRFERVVNEELGTVDYKAPSGRRIGFQTCAMEKERLVFQIGTADAVRALEAAKVVVKDVAAIDVNMGCPKHFSVQGGMGAALLHKPEIAADIIATLRRNLNVPVSCKIRFTDVDAKKTIEFAQNMEKAGACALGIHARYISDRPIVKAHWDHLALIPSALSIPVLANGDINTREDIQQVKQLTGCDSVLIARGAILNASIFRPEGPLPVLQVTQDYIDMAIRTHNIFQNTKYCVHRMLNNKVDASAQQIGCTMKKVGMIKNAPELYQLFQRDPQKVLANGNLSTFNKPATNLKRVNDENLNVIHKKYKNI